MPGLDNLNDFINQKFAKIDEVEYVFLFLEGNKIDIWTVVNKPDREIREKVYKVEYSILETFKDFLFDFHVVYRNVDRDISDICPSGAKTVYSKVTEEDVNDVYIPDFDE